LILFIFLKNIRFVGIVLLVFIELPI